MAGFGEPVRACPSAALGETAGPARPRVQAEDGKSDMNELPSIPFGRPMLGDDERDAVVAVLGGPRLVHGPVAARFESEFAERAGTRFAVSVSSCTAGLYLGLLTRGIGPDDEVIVPAMTHVATAHSVEFLGAKPVFVDVSARTGNIDPAGIEEAISGRTRAIIVVHYLGLPCDMDAIRALAKRAGAFLIEDAALALDATYDGVKTGGLADMASFSFYPVKHMTTAEGGMVSSNCEPVADLVRRQRSFGYDRPLGERTKPGIYDITSLGNNLRMSEIHAAIGLAQMRKLDAMQAARAENFARMEKGLSAIEELTIFPRRLGKAESSHYCLNINLPEDGVLQRDAVVNKLQEAGIGTSVHYPSAVPLFSYYRKKYAYKPGQFAVAEWIADQAISLPVGPHLAADDPERIVEAVKNAVMHAKRNP